ncbi:MAG TPA: hypothetical protein VLG14_02295 [Sphingomonas sp.]|jgi:hypothetical protein|nr:hypothetical protein [Sphingomonas sp.]
MSIYRRDQILPEWEPVPWTHKGRKADSQEAGFHARALKAIPWRRIDWADFPAEGVFGHNRDWLSSRDVEFVASYDGEDLLLIHNIWFGWPDPPEWGLASRVADDTGDWTHWGHFPDLPHAWVMPAASE